MRDFGKILDDPVTLEREAERFGKELAKKGRQIRLIYETVLKSPDLTMVKPRLNYQIARAIRDEKNDKIKQKLVELANYINNLVDEVRKKGTPKTEEFENARMKLLNFLEAIVAYARYYEILSSKVMTKVKTR